MEKCEKIIVVTGQIGVGKSTVCGKIVQMAKSKGDTCGGFLNYKSQDGKIIIEDAGSGDYTIFASLKPEYSGLSTGKFYFNPAGFDFGFKVLKEGLTRDLVFIDELGRLEVKGEGFAGVFSLLAENEFNRAVVIIRKELLTELVPRFHLQPTIFEVTLENRDRAAEEIIEVLF